MYHRHVWSPVLYRHYHMYRLYTMICLFILCYFSNLINMPFCFSRRFIHTVTVFTVLFTAWYRPNCIFTYLFYLIFKIINLYMYNNYLYYYRRRACVCVCVCKIGPISARTLSFRHQTSLKFFSHSNFPITYLWTAFCVPLSFVFYEKQ